MGEVNVAVIAPVLGRDLSFVTGVDPRVRVFDASFAAAGAGRDRAVRRRPVPVCWRVTLTSSRGAVAAAAIAEYALAAAAHFARGLHEAARQKAAGQFTRAGYRLLTLGGATMGVIGLGGIGREVARLSRAAGMRVIGTRRSVTAPLPDADGADLVLPAGRILEVAAGSDFLVVCAQLTAETRGFINAAVFAAMKPGAVLINVARGEEAGEDALVEAVIAGADPRRCAGRLCR